MGQKRNPPNTNDVIRFAARDSDDFPKLCSLIFKSKNGDAIKSYLEDERNQALFAAI